MAFWGVVKLISTQDGISQLPPEDDEKVADLANVMFYFFIICIILLGIYLICSILVIIGAAKVSTYCRGLFRTFELRVLRVIDCPSYGC